MVQSIVLLNAQGLYQRLAMPMRDLAETWRVDNSDFENLYDWCIIEGIRHVLSVTINRHITVQYHDRQDIFRCIFSEMYTEIVQAIQHLFEANGIVIKQSRQLKILVTYNEIIIVHKPFV